jgi:hypothetical protein
VQNIAAAFQRRTNGTNEIRCVLNSVVGRFMRDRHSEILSGIRHVRGIARGRSFENLSAICSVHDSFPIVV